MPHRNAPDPRRFPRRTVHLDFHTGPDIPDVGRDFDPAAFARTFRDAHVDSVTVFAKCHHGHLYHGTDRPERHPGLAPDLDLLAEQIDALHSVGIRAPIYLSLQVDEYAAREHPEWIAHGEDLKLTRWATSAFDPGWNILDMSSPYADYFADQLDEVLRRFAPVDGIFVDMCWDQPSASRWAVDGMRREGLDPADADHRARYATLVARRYMARYTAMVEQALPEDSAMGVWFNGRPKTGLPEERRFLRHVEVEGLPTGGWGYAFLPYVARFVRPLGLPALSHTGRFHESWGDNAALKPRAALLYECGQILSHGLTSGVGDVLHPRGAPSPAVYELIGSVYEHIAKCEPFLDGGRTVTEVALVTDPRLGDNPGASIIGAVRALQQLRVQFDVVPPGADLSGYRAVVVPETTEVDDALAERLYAYRRAGGAVLLVGPALLGSGGGPSLPGLPVEGLAPAPPGEVFLACRGVPGVREDFPVISHGSRLTARPRPGAEVLARVAEPYFPRAWDRFCGHSYTPPADPTDEVAVAVGDGVAAVTVPLCESFHEHGIETYRHLLGAALDRLLPDPLLRAGGPVHLETSVVRTGTSTVVHLLSFAPVRETPRLDLVHDPFPLVDVPVSVRLAAPPRSVRLQPAGQELAWQHDGRYVHTRVTTLDGHAMVVVEHD
ncbi:beta-galactosidase trimerization domain-containing protein [Streptomyces sp. TRM64462]|uniref:beta-galactosidase trimerization domain-containing protein n=1 Tax=Streptomyces sp. TRM64462 TaxID=2741726 RepID=UPI001586727F|nr:beta-galactosidase trimerization domain-containing protein [Streptomyces sp. TRM64462]